VKKKSSYSTRIVQLKKGVNEVTINSCCAIQSLCHMDIRISFTKGCAGIFLSHKQIRNYYLTEGVLYISTSVDCEIVIEESSNGV